MHAMPNSTVIPCCVWPYDDVFGDGSTQKIQDIWNNKKYRQLRLNMLAGKESKGCTHCYTLDTAGFHSMRKGINERFSHLNPVVRTTQPDGSVPELKLSYIDIRFSNLCNFRCRGCSPALSSSWYEDHQKLFNYKSDKPKVIGVAANSPEFWSELKKQISMGIEEVYFGGGEPLIAAEHFEVLNMLISQGMTKTRLSYNTNLSTLTYGNHDLAGLWNQFDSVFLGISMDDIGERAEYFRKGTDWKKMVINLNRLIKEFPKINRYINCTVNIHNAYYLPEIIEWAVDAGVVQPHQFFVNMLLDPKEYVLHIYPKPIKDRVRARLSEFQEKCKSRGGWEHVVESIRKVISFMDQKDISSLLPLFQQRTKALDQIRNESFVKVYPELSEMMTL